jgi:hypothetical protein
MKEDRGKKWSKEDKMVIKKLFHIFEYVFIYFFFNLCRLEKEKCREESIKRTIKERKRREKAAGAGIDK